MAMPPSRSATPDAEELAALRRLAERAAGVTVSEPELLVGGGSYRRYYRLRAEGDTAWDALEKASATSTMRLRTHSAIGVLTPNLPEARAFVGFTRHFLAVGLPVPQLYADEADGGRYVVEDLGDDTLRDRLAEWRADGQGGGGARTTEALALVMRTLARFQVRGARGLDPALCFEGRELGGDAFRADIAVFLTHYVPRFVLCPGPDADVLADIERLIRSLDAQPREHLVHRDFQTRNIMWPSENAGGRNAVANHAGPVLLDYQGARFGPLGYDLASILYSPDTGLTDAERPPLIAAYLDALAAEGVPQERAAFQRGFAAVVLVRRLQALGAYARIAVQEGKPAYLEKIPPALDAFGALLWSGMFALGLPHLERWLLRALSPEGRTVQ
jgi:aminoglycoside/choline kinase family phosphotransferase